MAIDNSNTEFYHLHTLSMAACTMEKDAAAAALTTWLCPECRYPKPEATTSISAKIQGLTIPPVAMTFVDGHGILLLSVEFVQGLDPQIVRRDLCLGEVFDERGVLMEGWVVARGRRHMLVRGTEHVAHRVCGECGRQLYFAMGKRYLYPSPPVEPAIFQSDLFGLIMPKALYGKVPTARWPNLVVDELPALSSPLDGLEDITRVYPSDRLDNC